MGILVLFALAYFIAALLDIATTCTALAQGFVELNPFVVGVASKPTLWLARDVASFLIVLVLACTCKAVAERLVARAKPSVSAEEAVRLKKLPSSAFRAVLLTSATVRWLPPIHNVLLLYVGIETPLPFVFERIFSIMQLLLGMVT